MLKPNQMKNCFNKYFFVYKDILGRWNESINPVFIAEHTCCRAIKYEDDKTLAEGLFRNPTLYINIVYKQNK